MNYYDEIENLIQKKKIWGKLVIPKNTLKSLCRDDLKKYVKITPKMIDDVKEELEDKDEKDLKRFLEVSKAMMKNATYLENYNSNISINIFLVVMIAFISLMPKVFQAIVIGLVAIYVLLSIRSFQRIYADYNMALECIIISAGEILETKKENEMRQQNKKNQSSKNEER